MVLEWLHFSRHRDLRRDDGCLSEPSGEYLPTLPRSQLCAV